MFPSNTNLAPYLESLSQNQWVQLPISIDFALKLKYAAQRRFTTKQFRDSTIFDIKLSSQYRRDKICWIDPSDVNLDEAEAEILKNLDVLKENLRLFFRAPIQTFESHYAIYEPQDFYAKHKDITTQNNKRLLSFVIYLNESWNPSDGGELIAYHDQQILFQTNPLIGKMLLFNSDLEHEVTTCYSTRYSLTGWYRKL